MLSREISYWMHEKGKNKNRATAGIEAVGINIIGDICVIDVADSTLAHWASPILSMPFSNGAHPPIRVFYTLLSKANVH